MERHTAYRTIQVDGLSIFYREAGPKNAPTILLLHGLPSSSRMFEPLFERLSDRYHLVAPDYPGFGHSDWPDAKKFAYTFDHIAEVMNHFTEAVGLTHYNIYMQDYGGPVGFRMILAHPERVQRIIVQDAVAHNTGLGPKWDTRRAFWADRAANEDALRTNLLSLAAARARHAGGDPDVERHDPDLWTDEFYFTSQPGQGDIQVDLFYDYRTNVENVSEVASVDAEESTEAAGDLGEIRIVFRSVGAGSLPARCADRRGAYCRRRTFRAGHGGG